MNIVQVPLGELMITSGALEAIEKAGQCPTQLLARHHFADWGELDDEDWARNDHALENGLQLLSSYRLRDRTPVWVVTEWDRSRTTILVPQEY